MSEKEIQPLALIIEDDSSLANIFSQAMKTAGFDTRIIQDGQMAMNTLEIVSPAVVVLDLHLPTVSGATILHALRATESCKYSRVIVTTADPLGAEMMTDKADFVLQKPVSFGQLRDLGMRLRSEWLS